MLSGGLAHFWLIKGIQLSMKAALTIVLATCLVFGRSPALHFYSIDDVVQAMRKGNAGQLANYFDSRVEITLHEKSSSYSASQAQMILKDFFNVYAVKTFSIIHKGSNSGSEFCIGNLQTKYGTFRTTIFMKSRPDKQVLQEIRFEENE